MITKKKQLSDRQPYAKSNVECFHYGKKAHYVRDCHSRPKQKPKDEKTTEKAKQARWQRRHEKKKAAAAKFWSRLQAYDDNDNPKSYSVGRAFRTRETNKSLEVWTLILVSWGTSATTNFSSQTFA